MQDRRLSNFDLFRLIAAATVIFSHSFAITEGAETSEPLVRLLGPGNIVGIYGVYIFFIISGFLITASFQKSSLRNYVIKRCLRIFPGLIVCAVGVALAGALVATKGHLTLSALTGAARYAVKTILLFDTSDRGLEGLVFSDNDYGTILNGSLWSLGPEFACYAGVAALGLAGVLGLRAASLALVVGLWTHWSHSFGNIGFVLPYFAAGAVLYFWRSRPQANPWTMAAALAGLVAAAAVGQPMLGFALFGSWMVIALATASRQVSGATRFGDLSYGVYLYGWPIEQVVRHTLGTNALWWEVFLLSLPLAAIIAALSWRLVEKPSLALAKRLTTEPSRPAIAAA